MATGSLSDSIADKAGLANRDVIVDVAGEKVKDLEHFKSIYERLSKAEPKKVVVKVLKGARTARLVVLNLAEARSPPP
jgi:C-terminal processing protease CtpA/Prc